MRFSTICFVLLFGLTVVGQTRTFRWDDDACQYSGTFDLKRFTVTQLRNTLKLSQTAGLIPLSTNSAAFKYSDVAALDVTALDREYAKKMAGLKALDIVPVSYWRTFRERKIRELEQAYRLYRVTMLAYRDPKALLSYTNATACTTKYVQPLIRGGDDLLAAWKTLNEESRKNNGDPESVRRTYEEQLRSPDRMQFAQIEVITFGWSNCANASIDYIQADEIPAKEFRKLFKRTRTIRCDEP
jgi:hypothetical protein